MIPRKLRLRNFMSYTDIHEPLHFDGIHVACLSGENGAGKSTLLDAITWALWGQSRARTQDQLVHLGRAEMEVELEFVLAETVYRVVRKRIAGSRGTTILDLAVCDEATGQFRSISGNSVGETERAIEDLLRMGYTTFTNSSFVLQGKADSFTVRTPAERKQVLADILELAEYDRFQERARREVQQRELRHRELEAGLRDVDAELARRPAYEQARVEREARLAELDERIQREEAALGGLRERLTGLSARERELAEAVEQVGRTRAEVDRHAAEIAGAERTRGQMQGLLEREAEIEQGYAELLRARAAEQELNARLAEFARLCDERNRLDKQVSTIRTRLESELAQVEQRLAQAEAEAARLPEHEREEARARAEVETLGRARQRRAELERALGATRERAAELRGTNQRLKGEMQELRGKIDVLAASPICPVCQSALDDAGRASLIERYNAEGHAQKAEYRRNQEEARERDGEIERLTVELGRAAAEVDRGLAVERRLANAEQAVRATRRAAEDAAVARADHARLRETLERGDFAPDEIRALEAMRRRLEALGYDEDAHRQVRADLKRAAPYETHKRELDHARQHVAHQDQILEQQRRSLGGWQQRLDAEQQRVARLRDETRELPDLRERVAVAERALAGTRRDQGETNRELGEARQRLAFLDHLGQQRQERIREMDELLREKGLYSDLVTAFGKNGVQAMIIETAIPEIEDEANRLLGAMTQGRMHVKLETQRAARSGDSTIETLDIVINDELGARSYEMYSGGEAFRVNFAIRIALSKLLARRAGARLQTLVIDEGFGSQDDQGRERLVEAIAGVADEFAMILVITHLEDLKDRFPVRIVVRKTALGSTLDVEWLE